MNIRKRKIIPLLALTMFLLVLNASAVSKTTSWTAGTGHSYTNFYPKSGTLQVTYNSNIASTRIDFSYSAQSAQQISIYNQSDMYAGMDIKDNGNAFSATTISTSLPNPKTDIESNPGHNYQNESEVVALGSITANKSYYMSTTWNDYRPILTTNSWYVNAELSQQTIPVVGDYNTKDWSHCTSLAYGGTQGAT